VPSSIRSPMVDDHTSPRPLEEPLRQAQELVAYGELADVVAHDLNNLLTAIIAYYEFAIEQAEPKSTQHADLEEIGKAARAAAELTNQLLRQSPTRGEARRGERLDSRVRDRLSPTPHGHLESQHQTTVHRAGAMEKVRGNGFHAVEELIP
jgi:signal transduction histidine kinase